MNSQCNLKCIHCTREQLLQSGWRTPKSLSDTELKHLLDQLKDCPIDTIKIEGLSEPILFNEIYDRIYTIRQYFPKAHLILISNLQYNVSKTKLLDCIKLIDALYISVDGTFDIYEKIRKGANYDRFINSLNQIKESIESSELRKIHFNFTATEENYLELPKIYQLKDEYQVGSVRINLVQNWDEKTQNQNHFSDQMKLFLKKYVSDLKGVAGWDYKNCFWIYNGIVIDVEGNIRQCVLNTTQIPLGNAFKSPIRELYNNSQYLNETRSKLSENKAAQACVTCDYKGLSPILTEIFSDTKINNSPRVILK